jgi:hypothetical protein
MNSFKEDGQRIADSPILFHQNQSGGMTTGFAIGPRFWTCEGKYTSTPPPDCPKLGTIAPQRIIFEAAGWSSYLKTAGKKPRRFKLGPKGHDQEHAFATICSSVKRALGIAPSESGASLSTYRWAENPGAGHWF